MNDCLQPSGGFIPIQINSGGYIHSSYGMVHRETRGMNTWMNFCAGFAQAKEQFPVGGDDCILELTPEGGGFRIWINPDQETEIRSRLTLWRRCYGEWDVYLLTPERRISGTRPDVETRQAGNSW